MSKISQLLTPSFKAMLLLGLSSCITEQVSPRVECPVIEVTTEQVVNTDCGETEGAFSLTVNGGIPPYTFVTNGLSNTTGSFSELAAGVYNVRVTDSEGCAGAIDVSILNENGVRIEEIAVAAAGCETSQGQIEVNLSGGVEPYSYALNGAAAQSSNSFSELDAGSYQLLVTDATGCEVTQQVSVTSGISYQTTIQPIVATNCAISGCHNGRVFPDLRTFDQVQASANRIKIRTANGSMPRGRTLSQDQIDAIACWVDDGALAN